MSKKSSTTRMQIRKMQRERTAVTEKALAKVMGMPKGLRQYFKRLGILPSSVNQEYLKAGYAS